MVKGTKAAGSKAIGALADELGSGEDQETLQDILEFFIKDPERNAIGYHSGGRLVWCPYIFSLLSVWSAPLSLSLSLPGPASPPLTLSSL